MVCALKMGRALVVAVALWRTHALAANSVADQVAFGATLPIVAARTAYGFEANKGRALAVALAADGHAITADLIQSRRTYNIAVHGLTKTTFLITSAAQARFTLGDALPGPTIIVGRTHRGAHIRPNIVSTDKAYPFGADLAGFAIPVDRACTIDFFAATGHEQKQTG